MAVNTVKIIPSKSSELLEQLFRALIAFTISIVLTVCVVFLQEGFSYYISFQVLACVIMVLISLISSGGRIKIGKYLLSFAVFVAFVLLTSLISENVIITNSSNIYITLIALFSYAFVISYLVNSDSYNPRIVLDIVKSSCSLIILSLLAILVFSESGLVEQLSPENLLLQNIRLIDNYTDLENILITLSQLSAAGVRPRNDLFYGEPSFLAIVLFVSTGGYLLSSIILNKFDGIYLRKPGNELSVNNIAVLMIGVLILMYLKSFASIIFAIIMLYYAVLKNSYKKLNFFSRLILIVILLTFFYIYAFDYFVYRLTQNNSVSTSQRFGFFSQLTFLDYAIGMKDVSRLPDVGLHNGLLYIISIAGVGGIIYLSQILCRIYVLARPLNLEILFILITLAVVMQNGGIFSPNKIVLLSLIFIPLTCTQNIPGK